MDWNRAELVTALDHLALELERQNTPAKWVALTKPAHELLGSDRRARKWWGSKRYPMVEHPKDYTSRKNLDSVWIWKKVGGRIRTNFYYLLPSALHDEGPDRWEQYRQFRRTMPADQALDATLLLIAV